MLSLFHKIPYWIWVILPVLVLGAITYAITRNRRYTLLLSLTALALAWLTAGFFTWEVYLHNHYLGRFDEYGLPLYTGHTGWILLLKAWPLWLIPVILATLITVFCYRILQKKPEKKEPPPKETLPPITENPTKSFQSADIQHKLEIQKLKSKLSTAVNKLQEKNEPHDIQRFKAALEAKISENKEFQVKVQELEESLKRAKALIKQLLDERSGN